MSYETALKAAGAAVLRYESFGSYQGDWLALCFYEGDFRWVHGTYGSCSGCDAFEAEFDWREDETEVEKRERLAAFGREYLNDYVTDVEELIARLKRQADWDSEAGEMIAFIEKYPLTEEGKNELIKQLLRQGD